MNKLKEKLKNNELSLGTWLQTNSPDNAEILSNLDFDWICVDLEHGSIDICSLPNIFRAIENGGCSPLVRLPLNDEVWIHRSLDAGARGLIIPMIKTPQDVKDVIKKSNYPNIGERGFGFSRANKYGSSFYESISTVNDDIVIIIQIEHIKAIDNIDQILEIDRIDATLIGPYDLSGSMNIVGDFDNLLFKKKLDYYLSVSKKNKIPAGIHLVKPTKKNIYNSIKNGYKLIALGTDAVFLEKKAKEILSYIIDKQTNQKNSSFYFVGENKINF